MKKISAILVCFVFLVLLSGCEDNRGVIGEWKYSKEFIYAALGPYSAEDAPAHRKELEGYIIVFNEDGSFTTTFTSGISGGGIYKFEGDLLVMGLPSNKIDYDTGETLYYYEPYIVKKDGIYTAESDVRVFVRK